MKPESYPEAITKTLTNNKTVFLYFYVDKMSDSKKNLKNFETVIKEMKNSAVLYKAEANDNEKTALQYGLEFIPTVFVLNPKFGITKTFVIDRDEMSKNAIKNNVKFDKLPSQPLRKINTGIQSKKPALLMFYADWCGYCQTVIPIVKDFERKYSKKINIVWINIDNDIEMSNLYLVNGVPTIIILNSNGVITERLGYPVNEEMFIDVFKKLHVNLTQ